MKKTNAAKHRQKKADGNPTFAHMSTMRGEWTMNPVTRVKVDAQKDKKKRRQEERKRIQDDDHK